MAKKLDHKFWAKYFRVYDVLNMVIPYQELLDTIVKELDIKKGDLILDAGCGTGNLAVRMSAKGAKVIGIDNCIEALDIYRLKDPEAEILVHDLTQAMPFPDNYFDKVACNNVLYTMRSESREILLKELQRVLKKGGKIVIANPHQNFKSVEIYKGHLKKDLKNRNIFLIIKDMFVLVPDTYKMFYYNKLIIKENKLGLMKFFKSSEQSELLIKNNFNNPVEFPVYHDQSILAVATK